MTADARYLCGSWTSCYHSQYVSGLY